MYKRIIDSNPIANTKFATQHNLLIRKTRLDNGSNIREISRLDKSCSCIKKETAKNGRDVHTHFRRQYTMVTSFNKLYLYEVYLLI